MARVLIWFVALAGLGLFARAQENSGNVFGRAVDDQGNGVPGATATLTGDRAPVSTVSDSNGNFRFLKVPPGRYKVTFTMPGFSTLERDGVIVTLGKNTNVEAPLKLSGVAETVNVSGTTPLLDTRKVQTGATFAKEELNEIPTSRDIYALMQQVPGVQLDSVNVAGAQSGAVGGPNFSTKGSGGVTYQVDGSTITDNSYGTFNGGQARQNGGTATYFDFESFDQVEVATGGSLLDLQTPGVTVNVVTKRGTNEFKGGARYFYVSDKWQSNNLPQEAIDQGFETDSTRFIREYGADLGGPIVKDKLWIWGSGSRQDIALNLTGTDPAGNRITSTAKIEPWSGKLNAQISSANSASLFYQRSDRFEGGVGNSPSRLPETRENLSILTNFYKFEDSHVFSPDLVASLFLNYQSADYDYVPVGGQGPQAVNYDDVWHGSYSDFITRNPQKQINATVSKFFNTGNVNHELKASFNYRHQLNDSASAWPGDQIFGEEYSSGTFAAVTRAIRSVYEVEYWTGTLGDTLTTGNLTINAGIRYDLQRGRNKPSTAQANPVFPLLFPKITYPGEKDWPFDYKNWEPRASATYALGKDHNTLLRASYARFADQLGFLPFQLNGIPQISGAYYYWNDVNHDHHVQPDEIDFDSGIVSYYAGINPFTTGQPPNALQPGFKSPTTDEFTFGLDHQWFSDFAVSATYTYRHAKDFQYRLPLGADPTTWALAGTAQGTATADNGFSLNFDVPFYFLTLADRPNGDLFLNRPGATTNYHGIEFTAIKRLSDRWMLRASGGWNSWTQHIPPNAILDPNNRYALGGQNDDGGLAVGYTPKSFWVNASWQFNVTGLYQLPWGINLGANFYGRQGYPQTYFVRTAQFDLDGSRKQNLIGHVDSFRLSNVYELDLRLEKTFKLGPIALSATAECFNVTNNNTVLQREGRAGTWDLEEAPGNQFSQYEFFNQILETQSPRIIRIGARITF